MYTCPKHGELDHNCCPRAVRITPYPWNSRRDETAWMRYLPSTEHEHEVFTRRDLLKVLAIMWTVVLVNILVVFATLWLVNR